MLYQPSMYSNIACRAVSRVGQARRCSSSVSIVAKNDSATALSPHNSTISALNSGVNTRRGLRDRFLLTLSMMLDILPETQIP
ncbi:hypothetical protein BG844_23990 [Couchioplanes caeruleus subsp. caeruleus]|uniref:Uncharacterized protein n=1 Tax=Couchioplanes caeruleus subsp. caeruleus TaxID=56427 RepID=A0A1K0FG65_9ACTN|nr:hypothetical protein BG844_23990 [Couchioplanes caeruleus subsp. caeruleus]